MNLNTEQLLKESQQLSDYMDESVSKDCRQKEQMLHGFASNYFDTLWIGIPKLFANLTVYPVFNRNLDVSLTSYASLEQGQRNGMTAEEMGCINAMLILNPTSQYLYALESENLTGHSQNRASMIDRMILPKSHHFLPVNCVELGQHLIQGRGFNTQYMSPPSFREYKTQTLASESKIHQGSIWDMIHNWLKAFNITSNTSDFNVLYEYFEPYLNKASSHFSYLPGQIGLIGSISGKRLFFDLFASPEMMQLKYQALIQSYTLEALMAQKKKEERDTQQQDDHQCGIQAVHQSIQELLDVTPKYIDIEGYGYHGFFTRWDAALQIFTSDEELIHVFGSKKQMAAGQNKEDWIKDIAKYYSLQQTEIPQIMQKAGQTFSKRKQLRQEWQKQIHSQAPTEKQNNALIEQLRLSAQMAAKQNDIQLATELTSRKTIQELEKAYEKKYFAIIERLEECKQDVLSQPCIWTKDYLKNQQLMSGQAKQAFDQEKYEEAKSKWRKNLAINE